MGRQYVLYGSTQCGNVPLMHEMADLDRSNTSVELVCGPENASRTRMVCVSGPARRNIFTAFRAAMGWRTARICSGVAVHLFVAGDADDVGLAEVTQCLEQVGPSPRMPRLYEICGCPIDTDHASSSLNVAGLVYRCPAVSDAYTPPGKQRMESDILCSFASGLPGERFTSRLSDSLDPRCPPHIRTLDTNFGFSQDYQCPLGRSPSALGGGFVQRLARRHNDRSSMS